MNFSTVCVVLLAGVGMLLVSAREQTWTTSSVRSGVLVTIMREQYPNVTDCTLYTFEPLTGAMSAVGAVSVCADRTDPNSQAVIALDSANSVLYYTTGSGAYVWAVDVTNAAATHVGSLAGVQGTPLGMGLSSSGEALYLVTTSAAYSMNLATGAFTSIVKQALAANENSAIALLGDSAWATTGQMLISYDLTSGKVMKTPCKLAALNLDFYPYNHTLVALSNYELYDVSLKTGVANKFSPVPDGDGYPGTHTLVDDTYFFADFQNMHTMSLLTYRISHVVPFDGYLTEGGVRYLPGSA